MEPAGAMFVALFTLVMLVVLIVVTRPGTGHRRVTPQRSCRSGVGIGADAGGSDGDSGAAVTPAAVVVAAGTDR